MARYHGRHRRPGRVARILATLDRPHSRTRRQHPALRVATWPVIGMVVVVTAIGFTQPERLGVPGPSRTVVIDR